MFKVISELKGIVPAEWIDTGGSLSKLTMGIDGYFVWVKDVEYVKRTYKLILYYSFNILFC